MDIPQSKEEIKKYNSELKKLKKQKKEYLKEEKKVPKRIEKRIWECESIIHFLQDHINTIQQLEYNLKVAKYNMFLPIDFNIPYKGER